MKPTQTDEIVEEAALHRIGSDNRCGFFTGQEQDTTTTVGGLYDFMFREYAPRQGRWISPDPAGVPAVNPINPQSWNRYAYVINTPLSMVDPLGLDPCPDGSQSPDGVPCVNVVTADAGPGPSATGDFNDAAFSDPAPSTPGSCTVSVGLMTLNFSMCPAGNGRQRERFGSSYWNWRHYNFRNQAPQPPYKPVQPTSTTTVSAPPPPLKPRCNTAAIGPAVKAAVNDFFSPPGADVLGDVGDTLQDKSFQRAAVGTLYMAANAAKYLVPAAEVAADAIPVAGQILLVVQIGKSLYEGGKAYAESVNQCYETP